MPVSCCCLLCCSISFFSFIDPNVRSYIWPCNKRILLSYLTDDGAAKIRTSRFSKSLILVNHLTTVNIYLPRTPLSTLSHQNSSSQSDEFDCFLRKEYFFTIFSQFFSSHDHSKTRYQMLLFLIFALIAPRESAPDLLGVSNNCTGLEGFCGRHGKCDETTGKCYCTTKGVIGPACDQVIYSCHTAKLCSYL